MIRLSQPVLPEEAIAQVSSVLRSGNLVHGQQCLAFEEQLAEFLGVKFAHVVSSGTAALHLALLALDIGHGDTVLVPDFTFVATANVVEMTGARAVIVDVERDSYNMNPAAMDALLGAWGPEPLPKAIIPVLEFGNPKNSRRYREIADRYGLALVEDAACAMGAEENGKRVGTFGDLACFSFHPRKTLTTGEGGAVVTNDPSLAERVRLLRSHGMTRSPEGIVFETIGLNYRLTDFQAAIGSVLLPTLPEWIERRRFLARKYGELLRPMESRGWITCPEIGEGHACQSYMIVLSEKFNQKSIIENMRERKIETNIGAQSMTVIGLYEHTRNKHDRNAVGRSLYKNGLVLPLHENLQDSDLEQVALSLEAELSAAVSG